MNEAQQKLDWLRRFHDDHAWRFRLLDGQHAGILDSSPLSLMICGSKAYIRTDDVLGLIDNLLSVGTKLDALSK